MEAVSRIPRLLRGWGVDSAVVPPVWPGDVTSLFSVDFLNQALRERRLRRIDTVQSMSTHETLTKKLAEEFLSGESEHDLSKFTSIEDAAAEALAREKPEHLDLPGLRTLSDAAAAALAQLREVSLDLSGLTSLSDTAAVSLAQVRSDMPGLNLGGVTSLSDAAISAFGQHEGVLSLCGLIRLSEANARELAKHKGQLSLNGLKSLSNAAAKELAKHEGDLCLNGLVGLSGTAAKALAARKVEGPGERVWTQGAAFRALKQAAAGSTLKEVDYDDAVAVIIEAQDALQKGEDWDALRLYSLAADQGLASAQYMVGRLHYTGRGVGRADPEEAFRWFERAAHKGFKDAQFNLGTMYSEGEGVGKDDVESCKWFLVVVAKGDKEADQQLNMVACDLNEEEQSAARRKAYEVLSKEGQSGSLEAVVMPKPSPTSWRDKIGLQVAMEMDPGSPRSKTPLWKMILVLGSIGMALLGACALLFWVCSRLFFR